MGLVKPAGERPPEAAPLQAPEARGRAEHAQHERHEEGGVFSADVLKVFLPSLLLSHLLAIGLGIYIGRRLTTSTSTF